MQVCVSAPQHPYFFIINFSVACCCFTCANACVRTLLLLQVGGMLTEFGAVGEAEADLEVLRWQCDGADALLQG